MPVERSAPPWDTRIRFSALDSWRGVCAIIVVLYHIDIIGAMYAGHFRGSGIVKDGFLFVDFFFVLSGFVIAHGSIAKINSAEDIVPFLIRRFGRVWPLHMAILTAFIGLELLKLYANRHGVVTSTRPFGKNHSVSSIFTSVLLVHSLGIHSNLKWNAPSWSISAEFYTYLVFALLLAARRHRLALISATAAAIGAFVVAAFSKYNMDTTVQYGLFRCLYGFFIGVLTYLLYRGGRPAYSMTGFGATAAEIAVVAATATFVAWARRGPISLASPLIFGATVYVFASQQGSVSTLLLTRPFRAAGERSYSIYITHALVLVAAAHLVKSIEALLGAEIHVDAIVGGKSQPVIAVGNDWMSDGLVVFLVVAVLGVSAVTYRLIEEPARAFFNNVAARKWEASISGARRHFRDDGSLS